VRVGAGTVRERDTDCTEHPGNTVPGQGSSYFDLAVKQGAPLLCSLFINEAGDMADETKTSAPTEVEFTISAPGLPDLPPDPTLQLEPSVVEEEGILCELNEEEKQKLAEEARISGLSRELTNLASKIRSSRVVNDTEREVDVEDLDVSITPLEGASPLNALIGTLNDETLRNILNFRKVPNDDLVDREGLVKRIGETHFHTRRSSINASNSLQREWSNRIEHVNGEVGESMANKSSDTPPRDDQYALEISLEMERLKRASLTLCEHKSVRDTFDAVTGHIEAVYKLTPEKIDQSVLLPEFFAPFPIAGKASLLIDIQFTPTKSTEKDETSPTGSRRSIDEEYDDYAGWMKKRGGTTHAFTKDFKRRYFELSMEKKQLTYFKEQPPEDPEALLARERRLSSLTFEEEEHDESAKEGGEKEFQMDEKDKAIKRKRDKLKKGYIELNNVHQIRPSVAPNYPEFAFELVTATRVWVLAPENEQKQGEWLKAICRLVEKSIVDPAYFNHTVSARESFGSHGKDELEKSTKTLSVKSTSTVQDVITEAFKKFVNNGLKMPSEDSLEYILKVPGFADFMTSREELFFRYAYVANSVSKGERPLLELLPPSDVAARLEKMGGKRVDDLSKAYTSANNEEVEQAGEADLAEEPNEPPENAWEYSLVMSVQGPWTAYKIPMSDRYFYRKVDDEGIIQQWSKPDLRDITAHASKNTGIPSVSSLLETATAAFEDSTNIHGIYNAPALVDFRYGSCNFEGEANAVWKAAHETVWHGLKENETFQMFSPNDEGPPGGTARRRATALDTQCEDDFERYNVMRQPPIPRRLCRSPARVRVLGLGRDDLSSPFFQTIRRGGVIDSSSRLKAISVRVAFCALGHPLPSGWMESQPVSIAGKKEILGFGPSFWMESKLSMHNMPSTTRIVVQMIGHVANDKGDLIETQTIASAAVQFADFNGRMIMGKRAVRLWPSIAVDPHDIMTGPCTLWEFDEKLINEGNAAGEYSNTCQVDGLQFKVPTVYLEFDSFCRVVEWPLLYNAEENEDAEEHEADVLGIEKSGWFFLEVPATFGTKWIKRWFVLHEAKRTLEWYESNRSLEPLSFVYLDNVEVSEVEEKSKMHKVGKGSTHKMVKHVCMGVNTSGSSHATDYKGKKNKISDTGKSIFISGQARYEIRAWMDAIVKVGKSQLPQEMLDDVVNHEESIRSRSGDSWPIGGPGCTESHVATNRLEWFDEFETKIRTVKSLKRGSLGSSSTGSSLRARSSSKIRSSSMLKKSNSRVSKGSINGESGKGATYDSSRNESSVSSRKSGGTRRAHRNSWAMQGGGSSILYDQWTVGGKDRATAMRAMKTDPLYQLNSDEKASLLKFKEMLKENEGFPALPKCLKSVDWTSAQEVRGIIEILPGWSYPERKQELLQLLDLRYQCIPVRNFAVQGLRQMNDSEVASCLPQLVQALKFDSYDLSDLGSFLLERAVVQPLLIGVPFFWCCTVELRSVHCRSRYAMYIHEYKDRCGAQQRALLDRQQLLWSETGLFAKIASAVYAQRGRGKKQYVKTLRAELNKIMDQFPPDGFELPIDPRVRVLKPKIKKCRVMSSAKLPLWLTFENLEPGFDDVMIMFKAGDDLRQDTMVLQLMRVMDSMWRAEGKQLYMSPYQCMATWHDGGMLEIVTDACTTAEIHMQFGGKYAGAFSDDTFVDFIKENNDSTDRPYEKAVELFMKSCAAYCVATYVMGIGDRHNDNIMLKRNGQYFHIDFGHFLGNLKYAFGIKRERTQFVFTPEMAKVLGGEKSEMFERFAEECGSALNILRENGSTLINLFLLMVPAGMPELASAEDINYLRDQLAFDKSPEDVKKIFREQIKASLNDRFKRIDNAMHIIKHN